MIRTVETITPFDAKLRLIQQFRKYIAHLWQECHNSTFVIEQEKILKVFKCYNFLWVQRRHNCSPAASFANCVMTLYLLKVHLQTFLSIPITQKCQILSFNAPVANERYIASKVQNIMQWIEEYSVVNEFHDIHPNEAQSIWVAGHMKTTIEHYDITNFPFLKS
jgi:hypothetical protein